MDTVNLHDEQQLAATLANNIAQLLRAAVDRQGHATMAVSGGSTPKAMFQQLSQQHLDWSKVTLTLVDERCVAADSERSNAMLVHHYLLQNHAANANFLPFHTDGEDLSHESGVDLNAATSQVDRMLADLPTFDCLLLGMGDDGHTASIFPESVRRDEALNPEGTATAILIDPVTVDPLRISQTAKRILNSEQIILHINGSQKSQLLDKIMLNPDQQQWPIAFFLTQKQTPMRVCKSDTSTAEILP